MDRSSRRGGATPGDPARPGTPAVVALAVGALYLLWRATTLGRGSMLAVSIPLLAVEVWAYVELVLLWAQARSLPDPVEVRSGPGEPVDIAIVAAGADRDELQRTLIAVRSVRGRGRVVVIDDVDEPRRRSLARDASSTYLVDAGARDGPGAAAHRHTTTERYLWLTAGQVPMPDLLEATCVAFGRPEVAVCQVATSLLNADALIHLHRQHDDDLLVNRVLGPALSRWDAGPWLGPASIVRRASIDDVGGFGGCGSITDVTLRLQRAGWVTSFDPHRLVATTAPEAMATFVAHRRQRAAEAFAALVSTRGPLAPGGLRPGQRIAHLATAARFATSLRLLVTALLAVAVLLTGTFPVDAPLAVVVALWAVTVATGAVARRALARGAMGPGDWVRQGWRTLGADGAALLDTVLRRDPATIRATAAPGGPTAGGLRALASLPVLDATAVMLDAALLVRAATLFDGDLLPRFTTGERIVAVGAALGLLVPIVDVLQVVVLRKQRRDHYRVPAVLEADLDGTPVTTVDLTPSGAGVLLPFAVAAGATTTLTIAVPGQDGTLQRVMGRAVVRSVRPDGPGRWRAGLELVQLAEPAREVLIGFCATARQAEQAPPAGDRTGVGHDEAAAAGPAGADRGHRARRPAPLRILTGVAAAGGATTLLFGPGATVAVADSPELVETICVRAVEGGPAPGVAVERLVGDEVEPLGATDPGGCLLVGARSGTTGFALRHRGVRYETATGDYAGARIDLALVVTTARVTELDGGPAPGAAIRFHTDRWRDPHGPADEAVGPWWIETLPGSLGVEVTVGGDRFVRQVTAGDEVTVTLSRLRLGDGVSAAIDRGQGWEPVADGTTVVPGRLTALVDDGTVVRLEVPEGAEVRLPGEGGS